MKPRRCRECKRELPIEPIPRYEVCLDCGWEPAPIEVSTGVWAQKGPQWQFLASDADEALYGGAAGGGKSEALLMAALRDIDKPSYRALLLRRTIREMRRSLIERALTGWYNRVAPGGFVGSPSPLWRFPSGSVIEFGNLEYERDLENYQSAEYQFIGFDELSHFTEHMYTYMLSRLRSSQGIRSRVRAGTNPPADLTGAWVLRRFAPWLDRGPDYHGYQAKSGERLYVITSRQEGERYVAKGTLDEEGNPAQSRVFIQAHLKDNPYLEKNDPAYKSRLLGLDPITRAQLLDGNWAQIDKPGALWQREWINVKRVVSHPTLWRIGVALDPSGSHRKGSDEAGIIAGGLGPCFCRGLVDGEGNPVREEHAFVLGDRSGILSASRQAHTAIDWYHELQANFVLGEINYGGEWIGTTIAEIDGTVNFECIHVSRGKDIRAEPIAAFYDPSLPNGGIVHHVGTLAGLENEQCTYDPRTSKISPGRMDALVILLSKLLLEPDGVEGITSDGPRRFGDRRGSLMS